MKNLVADLSLASLHLLDILRLYACHPNNEIVYYNVLFSVAIATNPTTVLELGTGLGLSSLAFIRALQYWRKHGGKSGVLHTCDINPDMLRRLRHYDSLVVPHAMPTNELALQWAKDPVLIDLLYIDADHSHEQSLVDFEHFSHWVVPDGLILFHDTYPLTEQHEQQQYSGSVWRTAKYIKEHYLSEFEIMTLPFLCGISLLRKKGSKYF